MLEKLMKFKASKKTSLLLSLFCILMCVTVLIGTSFAWFTDTVTSGSNRIQTGTLKVGMEYRTVTLGQTSQSWKDANGAGDILDPDALYEPGYVSLTLFRIENKGSLSFKYQLALKLAEQQGINVFGEPFKLSDYLSFNLIPLTGTDKEKALGATATYQREDALALLNNNPAELGFNAQNTVDAVMPAKDNGNANDKYDVVALVIYMPETVGNKAMYEYDTTAPSITLDFKLVATQYTDEKDSFDQYYDEKAVYNDENNPVRPNWTAFQYIKGDLANELVCYDGTGFPVVKVKSDAPLNGTLIVSECNAPIGFNVTAGTIYKSYNISVVDDNGNPVSGNFTVQMFVGDGYENDEVSLYHNGKPAADDGITNIEYKTDGYISFNTNNFSVFTAAINAKTVFIIDSEGNKIASYYTLNEAFAALNDGAIPNDSVVKLNAALNVIDRPSGTSETKSNIAVNVGKSISVDLNGCNIQSDSGIVVDNKGTLKFFDSSVSKDGVSAPRGNIAFNHDLSKARNNYGFILNKETGTLEFEDVSITSALTGNIPISVFGMIKNERGKVVITRSVLISKYENGSAPNNIGSVVYSEGGTLTVKDSKLSSNVDYSPNGVIVANGVSNVNIEGSELIATLGTKNTSYTRVYSGLKASNCKGTIKDSKITTDGGAGNSAALLFSNNSEFTFENVSVDTSASKGSGVSCTGGELIVKDCDVTSVDNCIAVNDCSFDLFGGTYSLVKGASVGGTYSVFNVQGTGASESKISSCAIKADCAGTGVYGVKNSSTITEISDVNFAINNTYTSGNCISCGIGNSGVISSVKNCELNISSAVLSYGIDNSTTGSITDISNCKFLNYCTGEKARGTRAIVQRGSTANITLVSGNSIEMHATNTYNPFYGNVIVNGVYPPNATSKDYTWTQSV